MISLAAIAIGAAAPSDPPLPGFTPGNPLWGRNEVAVGVGLWQLPAVGSGDPRLPRVNAHLLYGIGFGARRRGRFGVQFGAQSVPYGPKSAAAGRSTVVRFEPRLTHRWGSDGASLDTGLGVSLEAGDSKVPVGPVLLVEPRVWLGALGRTFIGIDARWAPVHWGVTNMIACPAWCDQSRVYNPGGTGLLLRVGRVLDAD